MRGATCRLASRLWVGLAAVAWGTVGAAPAAIEGVLISKSGDTAEVEIRFACQNQFLDQSPTTAAAAVEIALMRMDRCGGAGDSITEATRPPGRGLAALVEIGYTARSSTEATLTLQFDRAVTVTVDQSGDLRVLRLHVRVPAGSAPAAQPAPVPPVPVVPVAPPGPSPEQIERAKERARAAIQAKPVTASIVPMFVLNLRSTTQNIDLGKESAGLAQAGQLLYVTDTTFDDKVWHRLRLGFFATEEDAHAAWLVLRTRYPDAWVTRASAAERAAAGASPGAATADAAVATAAPAGAGPATLGDAEAAVMLTQARGAIIDQDYPRAIDLTMRLLQEPPRAETAEARELLGVAHERNGQVAQAVAEYRRYLADYPEGEGAARVDQRLAALTTAREQPRESVRDGRAAATRESPWEATGVFSQYYRRDSSDLGGPYGWITQSAVFTDGDFTARYRGERFDFSTRTTAAYRYSIDEPTWSSGSQTRFYNLYVDLQDRQWGLGARLGRQRIRSDGILGLFDGLHASWQMQPDVRLNLNAGFPVYSSADDFNTDQKLYGASVDFTNLLDRFDASAFFVTQTIDGIEDRQAVGGEVRYVDDRRSLIAAIDFDTGYSKVTSLNLLGNWSFDDGLTVSASADYRRSPFLTTETALVGQTGGTIDELRQSLTEDQIRDLALDRSGEMLTYSIGLSRPLAERWQVNGDFTYTQTAQGPGSGGVLALPDSGDEFYVYTSLVGSSLLTEGDVTTFGLRYSDTYAARISSFYLDSRYPITNGLRFNPRLEVALRKIVADDSTEWLLIPSLRLLYRFADHYQIELEGGGDWGRRTGGVVDTDATTYFLYAGYQADF